MSAEVVTLPVIRVERGVPAARTTVLVSLSNRDVRRLEKLAEHWRMPLGEVASDLLSESIRRRTI